MFSNIFLIVLYVLVSMRMKTSESVHAHRRVSFMNFDELIILHIKLPRRRMAACMQILFVSFSK